MEQYTGPIETTIGTIMCLRLSENEWDGVKGGGAEIVYRVLSRFFFFLKHTLAGTE